VQVSVHSRLQHRNPAKLVELRRASLIVEGASNQQIEIRITRFARGLHQIGTCNSAEFWADKDGGAFFSA